MPARVLFPALYALTLLPATTTTARPAPAPRTDGVTVTVVIEGATGRGGVVGAALFSSDVGFPEASEKAAFRQLRPHSAPVDSFVFRNVPPGRYAAAAQHDLDGDGVLDKNFVGMPQEPWGVSRDVRHRMRAPRFEEAVLDVKADARIVVRVAR